MWMTPEDSQKMFETIMSLTMAYPVMMSVFYTIFVGSFIGLAVYLVRTNNKANGKEVLLSNEKHYQT